jgi:T5SS/PEP-CTERM-associated repeat protein
MSGGGDATLAVNGGQVNSSGTSILGADAGATGTVTISAGGWTNSGVVQVGNSGSGSMVVDGGLMAGMSWRHQPPYLREFHPAKR